jgi:hypothetical protein
LHEAAISLTVGWRFNFCFSACALRSISRLSPHGPRSPIQPAQFVYYRAADAAERIGAEQILPGVVELFYRVDEADYTAGDQVVGLDMARQLEREPVADIFNVPQIVQYQSLPVLRGTGGR